MRSRRKPFMINLTNTVLFRICKIRNALTISVILFIKLGSYAQVNDCDSMYKHALDLAFNIGEYELALKKLAAAKICNPNDAKYDSAIVKIYKDINQQKINAVNARNDANTALKREKEARRETELQKRDLQNQLARNYWLNSKTSREKNDFLTALHLAAEGITMSKDAALTKNMLLDINPNLPLTCLKNIFQHQGTVQDITINSSETLVVTCSWDHTAQIWNIENGILVGKPLKHNSYVLGVQFSPDENSLLTWSGDNTIRLWDVITGNSIGEPFVYPYSITNAKFSDNGKHIIISGIDYQVDTAHTKIIRFLDIENRNYIGNPMNHVEFTEPVYIPDAKQMWTWHKGKVRIWDSLALNILDSSLLHESYMCPIVFNKDYKMFLTFSNVDSTARIWDVKTQSLRLPPLKQNGLIEGALFSHDNRTLLTWGFNIGVNIWRLDSNGYKIATINHQNVRGASFSQKGEKILTWGDDRTAAIWNAESGQQIAKSLKHDDLQVYGAKFIQDEKYILTYSTDETARIWDSETGAQIGTSLRHVGPVVNAKVLSKSNQIITYGSRDNSARLWKFTKNELIQSPRHIGNSVLGARTSPDKKQVLAWAESDSTQILNLAKPKEPTSISVKHNDYIYEGTFFMQGRTFVIGVSDSIVYCWDADSGKTINTLSFQKEKRGGIKFSNNSSNILIWDEKNVALVWDVLLNKQISVPLVHNARINNAIFSHDNKNVLIICEDYKAYLWDIVKGRQIGDALIHNTEINGAGFSHNDKLFATWTYDGTVHIWNSQTASKLVAPLKQRGTIWGTQFTRDDKRILTWANDGSVRLWDITTGKESFSPLRHNKNVSGAIFSESEKQILSWSDDYTARLWDIKSGKQIGQSFKHEAELMGASFSPTNSHVLTWSRDSTTRLWDINTSLQVFPPLRHNRIVNYSFFATNGHDIITWCWGENITIWRLGTDLDLPPTLFKEQAAVMTGWELDESTGELQLIETERWRKLYKALKNKSKEHSSNCKFPEFSFWHYFFFDDTNKPLSSLSNK